MGQGPTAASPGRPAGSGTPATGLKYKAPGDQVSASGVPGTPGSVNTGVNMSSPGLSSQSAGSTKAKKPGEDGSTGGYGSDPKPIGKSRQSLSGSPNPLSTKSGDWVGLKFSSAELKPYLGLFGVKVGANKEIHPSTVTQNNMTKPLMNKMMQPPTSPVPLPTQPVAPIIGQKSPSIGSLDMGGSAGLGSVPKAPQLSISGTSNPATSTKVGTDLATWVGVLAGHNLSNFQFS